MGDPDSRVWGSAQGAGVWGPWPSGLGVPGFGGPRVPVQVPTCATQGVSPEPGAPRSRTGTRMWAPGAPGRWAQGRGLGLAAAATALTSSKSEPTLAVTSSTAVPGAAALPAIVAWAGGGRSLGAGRPGSPRAAASAAPGGGPGAHRGLGGSGRAWPESGRAQIGRAHV